MNKKQVTPEALVKRINKVFTDERHHACLHKSLPGWRQKWFGEYYVTRWGSHTSEGEPHTIECRVDLEGYARKMGLMADHEQLAT